MSLVSVLADQLGSPPDPALVRALLAELLRRGLSPDATLLLGPWVPEPAVGYDERHVCHDVLRGWGVAVLWPSTDTDGIARWHGSVDDPPGIAAYEASADTREELEADLAAWLTEQGWCTLEGL